MKKVRVRVPASTSNLGPGFDALGLALQLYNYIEMEEVRRGLNLTVEGEGKEVLGGEGRENLVIRAAMATFDCLGYRPKGINVHLINSIPVGKGLGSSGAACLGGIGAASKLAGVELSKEEILRLAFPFEGHSDNIVSSLVGGFTASCEVEGRVLYVKISIPEALKVVVVIPGLSVSTAEARRILPREVSLADAAFNIGRVALLVGGIVTGKWGVLAEGARDKLHQPYRASLLPGMERVFDAGYREGALACFLSGAGSALVALVDETPERVGQGMQEVWQREFGAPCEYRVLEIDHQGLIFC